MCVVALPTIRRRLETVRASVDNTRPVRPCWHYTQAGNLRKKSMERDQRHDFKVQERRQLQRIASLPPLSLRDTPQFKLPPRRRVTLPASATYC